MTPAFRQLIRFANLLAAWRQAARGKRGTPAVARFEHHVADHLIALQRALANGSYRPGGYRSFHLYQPKRRRVSAASFTDRIVHHALVNIIEPRFERVFIPASFANRKGLGTHRALAHLQALTREHRYALRLDIAQHFASIDHAILLDGLRRKILEPDVMALVARILASGAGVHAAEQRPLYFPGDDLFAALRPRGLPIGNLTSQFWSNCYLHPLDLFVTRELRCRAYLRYVDDFVLLGDSKRVLYAHKHAIVERLARLRLRIHEREAQVVPVAAGIPWLGFLVWPDRRRLKARKVRHATRALAARCRAWCDGEISAGEFAASVRGFAEHARHAGAEGLVQHVLVRAAASAGLPPRAQAGLADAIGL